MITSARWRRRAQICSALALSVTVLSGVVEAQKPLDTLPAGKNPHLGNKASMKSGLALYRVRCGDCHGLDGGVLSTASGLVCAGDGDGQRTEGILDE